MRTDRVLLPQSTSFSALMMFLRACALSSGATASSRSRDTTSAADSAAFLKSFGLLPGTASSLRFRRAGAGSRPDEHTSDLQSLLRISSAVLCLETKKQH